MKKIVSGEVLKDKMKEAVNLLCDTVKCTLGPKGNNVIIDHSSFSPFITNDGVTIAENIESDDEIINVILELAKEASIKTNQLVGDGTTTTLVLLQSLFNNSMKCIDSGKSPIVLKNELNEFLNKIIQMLEDERLEVKDEMIENIAIISSNDREISKVVSEVFSKIKFKEAVSIKEIEENKVDVNYYKGYEFQSILASPLFLIGQSNIKYENSLFLIVDDVISDIENISGVLNEVMKNMKSLVIIAKDYSDYFVNNILSYVLNGELKCVLLKVNEYGIRLRYVEKDLEVLSGAKIINSENNISVHDLGMLKSVYINNDETRIDFHSNERLENYISKTKEELVQINDDYMREFYNKRLAMFDGYTASILIGANTKTELRERRMRLEDAICAVYSSKDGVLVGGGLSLLKMSDKLSNKSNVEQIWKNALEEPFKQLMFNSGIDYKKIEDELYRLDYNYVFNLYNEEYESIDTTKVVDTYDVVVKSLINACSIASMLITTNSLIINEQLNNIKKINDYDEI